MPKRRLVSINMEAKLVLLRKGDKPLAEPSSYRPICLLDTTGKFLEIIIKGRLEAHITKRWPRWLRPRWLEQRKIYSGRNFKSHGDGGGGKHGTTTQEAAICTSGLRRIKRV